MNAYTVKVIRGNTGARDFALATYQSVAMTSAAARSNVLEFERSSSRDQGEPLRCALVEPSTDQQVTPMRVERISADEVAKLEGRGDAYVTAADGQS